MNRLHVVELETHHVGDTEHQWCHHCLLPSATAHRFVIVTVATLHVLHRFTLTVCEDCGRAWKTR